MLKISCYLHKIYQGYVSATNSTPPWVKNLSWCLVIAVHMFSSYLHIKIPGEGGIVPCYLHRRYRSIFSKKNIFPMIKVTMVFLVSCRVCGSHITVLFSHKLPRGLEYVFQQLCFPLVKIIAVFIRKLSDMQFIYYRVIFT